MATAFVAFARIGSRPSQISAGKESSVPPPAMELIAPAKTPAMRMIRVSSTGRDGTWGRSAQEPPLTLTLSPLDAGRGDYVQPVRTSIALAMPSPLSPGAGGGLG